MGQNRACRAGQPRLRFARFHKFVVSWGKTSLSNRLGLCSGSALSGRFFLEPFEPGLNIVQRGRKRLGLVAEDDFETFVVAHRMATWLSQYLDLFRGENGQPVPCRHTFHAPHARSVKFFAAHLSGPDEVAGREGFEPPEGLHLRRFSRPEHSTTLPPTLGRAFSGGGAACLEANAAQRCLRAATPPIR